MRTGSAAYGRNIYVQDNTIENYPWAGVAAASTYNLFIDDTNQITNNSTGTGNNTGGVLIEDLSAPACDQVPRDTQGVTISGNTITATTSSQPDGVKFGDRARNTISGVSISANTFSNFSQAPVYIDNPIVVVNGTIACGANCPTTGGTPANNPPRALTPDAVSPITVRCPTPGNGKMRETLTFEGSDVLGSHNVQDLEVDLSLTGPPTGPDTGAGGCHFLYTPYRYPDGTFVNLVYLADGNGTMWQAGNTVVGAGGADLKNGYCTIHAASSSYSLTKDPYILNLTLDIEFEDIENGQPVGSISKAHIYVLVTNHSLQYVSGDSAHPKIGAWTYYGWWAQP